MRLKNPLLAVALILTVGAVACSTDLAAPPSLSDAQVDADIAATAGDAVATEIAGFTSDVAAAGSFTMVSPSFNMSAPGSTTGGTPRFNDVSASCSYANGRYTCAATTEQGLTVSRSFAFYDAQGNTVQTFDPATVESVNFQAEVDGNFQRDIVWSAGVHRSHDVTVSGLISQAPQRQWNGTGAGNDTISHIGFDGIRSLAGAAVDTVKQVVMPGPDAESQIPLSGSVIVAVDYTASLQGATGTVSRDVKRKVTVTFNGTSAASLEIGSLSCVLHLDTHAVDSCQ